MFQIIKHHTKSAFPAFYHRNFQIYFLGQFVSLIGTWLQMSAEQWLVYPVLTHSKILLGLVGVAGTLPVTLLVLFTGVYVDRVDKKKILFVTQTLFMIYAFTLSFLVWTKQINIWYVMLFALLGGITFAFDMPTRQAFIVETVEKESLPSAISLNAGAWNMARIIGPPLAGFLIAAAGIAICYFLNAISFLAVIFSLLFISLPAFKPVSEEKSVFSHFKEGWGFLKTQKQIIFFLLALTFYSIFSFSFINLLPVFTHDIFHADEKIFGFLGGAMGLGATIGAFSFSLLFSHIKSKVNYLYALTVMTFLSLLIFAFSSSLAVSFLVLVIIGFAASSFISAINTIIQISIPNNLRGRIMSFFSLVFVGAMPLGSLYAGLTAHFLGAPLTVFIGALISFVTLLWFFYQSSQSDPL